MACYTYPEQLAVPGVPAHARITPISSWNGGANSVDELAGDVVTTFTMGAVVGVVVGFTTDRLELDDYARIEHGLYFSLDTAGARRVQVIEDGVTKTEAMTYAVADVFEIRRVGSTVSYWRAGALFYLSRASSTGTLSVGAHLYATGDKVP